MKVGTQLSNKKREGWTMKKIVIAGCGCLLISLSPMATRASETMIVPDNYQVPKYQVAKKKKPAKKHKSYRHRSRGFPAKRKATGNRVFIFSPRMKAWAAYDANGNLVRTGRASGGKHYCRDVGRSCRTPRGVFRIISKRGPKCRSSRYPVGKGGAPMPYCMFFSKYYAIHGSPDVPNYNASHGCVRVIPSAARWLSRNFIRIGTTVIVTSY